LTAGLDFTCNIITKIKSSEGTLNLAPGKF